MAARQERGLGDEPPFFGTGGPRAGEARPRPTRPLRVGIDGGSGHARAGAKRTTGWFELIVGPRVPSAGAANGAGVVTRYDTKPKRRRWV